jgi:FtsX-like permease family protein
MGGLTGPAILIAARARRRPGRWLATVLGIAIAVAFGAAIAAEATIAGDQGARSTLAHLSPSARAVRITAQGPGTPALDRRARALLAGLGLGRPTDVVLLNAVRLSGVVVRPAAIDPLGGWLSPGGERPPGRCLAAACPMLVAGGQVAPGVLAAAGVRLAVTGRAPGLSPVPLGFVPAATAGQTPLLLTGDVPGLDAVSGLSGVYRTRSWLALLPTGALHSWQLAGLERRLQRAQAALADAGGELALTAPFAGLDAARAQAAAAPRRMLLVGGGALAVLAGFVVLAAGGLRRDQRRELARLRAAGARPAQCLAFVVGEAACLAAAGLIAGAGLAVATATLLARAAGLPATAVLAHSLITPLAGRVALAGWVAATALLATVLLARGRRLAELLAVAAASSLALALSAGASGSDTLPALLAPLCAATAGVLVFLGAAVALRAGERLARRGPAMIRLAFVALARAPAAPSLAIAFVATGFGLGGFTLAYRATLLRGAADRAAATVPLDATVSPAADFTTPLELAPLGRWAALGAVAPVRRTDATYLRGAGSVTVPALGVPAAALGRIHGWRAGDGSASLETLALRIAPSGPVRVPGPLLGSAARRVSVRLGSATTALIVTADLRGADGAIRRVELGAAGPRAHTVGTRLPPGNWELAALELDEPAGLDATNGHQNAENPAGATQSAADLAVGPVRVSRARGPSTTVPIGDWRAVGAAARGGNGGRGSAGGLIVRFAQTGQTGILRPAQPSDSHPVPVLVDRATAAAATAGGRLGLTVDGLPVSARIVGVLGRFPTIGADADGFVIADEATLAAALDAERPGQGRADELWISTGDPGRLAAALRVGPLASLGVAFRERVAAALRSDPVSRGVLRTLVGASAAAGTLALLGLLVALLGPARDRRAERDLAGLGVGPRDLRQELCLRLAIAAGLGVAGGLVIGVLLTRLAVAAVGATTSGSAGGPPLVAVTPWAGLATWGAGGFTVLVAGSVLATTFAGRTRRPV